MKISILRRDKKLRKVFYKRASHFMFLSTKNGPFSLKSPKRDEPPGPPCNHSNTGAVADPVYRTQNKLNKKTV